MAGITDSRGPLGPIALVLGPLLGVVFLIHACTPATQGTGKGTGKETEGCYGGAFCDPGLQCVYGFCVADDETEGESEDEVDESSSESTTAEPESTTSEASTSDDPSEESTSESADTTNEESTSETSEDSTTGEPFNCGWAANPGWYMCEGEGEDPEGSYPLECPLDLIPGSPCGDVTAIGCCDAAGDLWYCLDNQLKYDPC
ncbi:MAG: hypothetical protein HC927_13845 [Deltaproteobacteria bacterium]|nr:hypothetical protein [Deltaproteobacteria bacterium]